MRIGFIGLGIMGSRMAANLRAKGHEVVVYNRTRARADALLAAGATWAESPRALAATPGLELICTCVADPPAMEEIAFGAQGFVANLAAGTRVVDFSTQFPALIRRLAAAVAERGGALLEAPMTGSRNAAQAGTLLLMCGGDRALFDALQPVLAAVSAKAIYVGAIGQATQVKLIGNVFIAHMLEALSEGAALAARSDIPLAKVLEVVQSSGYASPYWDFKGKALIERDFTTHFSIDLMHKDLTLALATAHDKRVSMPGTAAIREVYQLARVQGRGGQDIMATATVIDPDLNRPGG
ncbi:MAG TPA: NAD(P)-dependent oxidoreductase [Polyangia bacterium]|jgi:3-hydroxyisobutyrate dehydrogenase-like beta-hydroxyacid dehydrogenase|nr:NAD(P)-dependent oxidoreductase [Polyangia bacterium]